jgi:eukaryotic-like serine/threonine-protein kinase
VKICPVCSTEYPDDVKFCSNDGQTLRAAAPTTDLVGQVVADRYHVIKKLGEGGMGQVYLAEHVKMGRRSAIKVMNPSMVHDPDAVARFNREASNASRITHPNVCAIYDFGETPEGLIYLAMEFIEGEPLTNLLERDGALPVQRAVGIFMQVADALQAAHDLGIVHRDLKPDNIMIMRSRDGTDVVKVVDFGIAKAVGGDEAGQKVTKTGLVVGTPEFMSPEQLSGDKVDGRSDLYSLALVFYRTLTGKLPFEAETVQETMIKRLTDEPKPLTATRPDLQFPPGLQPTLDSALTRSPVDRYQSVTKFSSDVASVVGFQRGTGLATPVPATRADVEGKTQLLDSAATKAMAARPAPRPAASPSKRRTLVPVILGVVALLGAGGGAIMVWGGGGDGNNTDSTALRPADSTPAGSTTTPPNPNVRTNGNPVVPLSGRDTSSHTPIVAAIDVAQANDRLGELFDAVAESSATDGTRRMARDSAKKFFDARGIAVADKAFAAYVLANAFDGLGDRSTGCRWAQQANQIETGNQAYQLMERSLCTR